MGQRVEPLRQAGKRLLTSLGEAKRPGQSVEQRNLKQLFQRLHLMAYGCRRHIQFRRRLCETQMPGGRFERFQRV